MATTADPGGLPRRGDGLTRRRLLAGGAALGLGTGLAPALIRDEAAKAAATAEITGSPGLGSTFFSTAFAEYADSYDTASDGDLWPAAWADDGHLYAANGDGRGFGDHPFADTAMNRILGTPETGLTGERLSAEDEIASIWGDPAKYNRKPTGMVAVDGNGDGRDELYVAVQDLRKPPESGPGGFDDAPNASVSMSLDYGRTWQKTSEPMFTDYRFTTIFFLDYGQSQENAQVLGPDGAAYVYAYGMDYNWRDSFADTVPDPTRLYLARIPRASIMDRSTWEFFAGTGSDGRPTWNTSMGRRVPVLHDERRVYPTLRGDGPTNMSVISQGSVVYNRPLDRYIYTSWTEFTFEFYEAPQPWGPWKLFMRKDFGCYPWFGRGPTAVEPSKTKLAERSPHAKTKVSGQAACPGPKNGGYATTIPSKFISADGKSMWLQCNWFVGVGCGPPNYNFSLRKFEVEPFAAGPPSNEPDPSNNLARTAGGAIPIEKSAHYGNGSYYNDGVKDHSEDSFDCTNKTLDFWGYLWPLQYNLNRVVYTTGAMFGDGGWFSAADGGLRVQVRQDFQWVDVTGLRITPDYPYDKSAGPNKQYTLTFDDIAGDGLRIVGPPGGTAHFTSIGELEVYYGPRRRS